jgi:hypothetical protein
VDLYESGGSANHNALQVQANRRMSRTLSFGWAYAWSKTLGLGDQIYTSPNQFNNRAYNYGRVSYDRRQILTVNFIYHLPKPASHGNILDHRGVRMLLNDWELSGLVTAQTGTPAQFSYGITGVSSLARVYTGSDRYGPRPLIFGNWQLPSSQMNELQQFNVGAIQPAIKPSIGLDSGQGYWSNPGTFWSSPELTLFKNFPYSHDNSRRYIQLRLETYNTFNHHDYTGRNMGATFRSATDFTLTNLPIGVSTISNNGGRFGFGALNGAASPRRVQLSLKVYF